MSLILCPQFQNTISRQRNRCCAIPALAAALVRQFAGIANLGIATGNCPKGFLCSSDITRGSPESSGAVGVVSDFSDCVSAESARFACCMPGCAASDAEESPPSKTALFSPFSGFPFAGLSCNPAEEGALGSPSASPSKSLGSGGGGGGGGGSGKFKFSTTFDAGSVLSES